MRIMRVVAQQGSDSEVVWEVTMSVGVAEITNEVVSVTLTDEPNIRPAIGVVATRSGNIAGVVLMAHWAEKWVGREYRPGEWDCADMVREVVMERTGLDVPLPSDREWRGMLPSTLVAFGETVVEETHRPEDGDCVLMKIKGHKRSLGSHVGIFASVNGQAWVLHALAERGVVFCPVDQIGRMALEVVGYYSWR